MRSAVVLPRSFSGKLHGLGATRSFFGLGLIIGRTMPQYCSWVSCPFKRWWTSALEKNWTDFIEFIRSATKGPVITQTSTLPNLSAGVELQWQVKHTEQSSEPGSFEPVSEWKMQEYSATSLAIQPWGHTNSKSDASHSTLDQSKAPIRLTSRYILATSSKTLFIQHLVATSNQRLNMKLPTCSTQYQVFVWHPVSSRRNFYFVLSAIFKSLKFLYG